MVLKPGAKRKPKRIFNKWELDFAVIGKTTDTDASGVKHEGRSMADIADQRIGDEAPVYERPYAAPVQNCRSSMLADQAAAEHCDALKNLIGCPTSARSRWVLGAIRPRRHRRHACSARAAMRRWCACTTRTKALAITTDVTPRYCEADPFEGGKQAVAEACRNFSAVGARPLAVTDNLNFGNPERPEIMGQFVGCVERHRRGVPRARFSDRLGQCLALQRDQRQAHPADAGDRRCRPDG